MADGPGPEQIEVRIETVSQLFQSLDPFPFREKDLDPEAESYIVGWARELPSGAAIRIVVHLPAAEAATERAATIGEATERFFEYRAQTLGREINEMFRVGRYSLAVGAVTLVSCIALARLAAEFFAASPVAGLIQESFLILGWVANWRPLEIFLYDWWPLRRRRKLFRRLAAATVELKPY